MKLICFDYVFAQSKQMDTVRDIENQLDEIQIPIGSPPKTQQLQTKKQNNVPLFHWIIRQSKSIFAMPKIPF